MKTLLLAKLRAKASSTFQLVNDALLENGLRVKVGETVFYQDKKVIISSLFSNGKANISNQQGWGATVSMFELKKATRKLHVGDLVQIECDNAMGTDSEEVIKEITKEFVITKSGHKFDRETGGARSTPFAYCITEIARGEAVAVAAPRKMSVIKDEMSELLAQYHVNNNALKEELKRSIKRRQRLCKHPSDRIKERSVTPMWDEGRSSGPPPDYQERYCGRCKKVLARTSTEQKEIWHNVK